jgi:hypothetical protein
LPLVQTPRSGFCGVRNRKLPIKAGSGKGYLSNEMLPTEKTKTKIALAASHGADIDLT